MHAPSGQGLCETGSGEEEPRANPHCEEDNRAKAVLEAEQRPKKKLPANVSTNVHSRVVRTKSTFRSAVA